MDWNRLLSTKRVRDLLDKGASHRTEGDPRTEFERDYGRVVFSSPVRRLQDKAQVFPLEPLDFVRTRLTHSMEVSSVARGIATGVGKGLLATKKINEEQAQSIAVIATTCGLIHDLGNPPFGHSGENAIRAWFEEHPKKDELLQGLQVRDKAGEEIDLGQDFLRFDGNAQTIRLVSRLQMLADPFGLNLTCGTLSALMKYVAASDQIDQTKPKSKCHERSKLGFFRSEQRLGNMVRDETGTSESRNPIAYIVEAADDICYSIADLEDVVHKDVFTWEQLEKLLVDSPAPDGISDCVESAKEMVQAGLKRWTEEPEGKAVNSHAHTAAFRTVAIARLVKSAIEGFVKNADSIQAGDFHSELLHDCTEADLLKRCKDIGRRHVYCSKPNLRLEVMGKKVIHDLMDVFWAAACEAPPKKKNSFNAKVYTLMSTNYRNIFENAMRESKKENAPALPEKYHRLQLVTDYVCGMTDTYACTLHKQLFNA